MRKERLKRVEELLNEISELVKEQDIDVFCIADIDGVTKGVVAGEPCKVIEIAVGAINSNCDLEDAVELLLNLERDNDNALN